jgi:molybdenum cofactor synthesis domain-containing protein
VTTPINLTSAVLTCSDRCSQGAPDLSGPRLSGHVKALGFTVIEQAILPDDLLSITRKLLHWSDDLGVSLVVTTGGTGASPRDVTPEATRMVLERPFPGIGEALRAESLRHTPTGMLSRGEAGSRGRTLFVNFPGSPEAVDELWPVIAGVVVHACRLLSGEADSHPR